MIRRSRRKAAYSRPQPGKCVARLDPDGPPCAQALYRRLPDRNPGRQGLPFT